MNRSHSAGGVVINQKGQVIVVSQFGTSWAIPKGNLEKDEDSLTAAKREIYEETGVKELEYIRPLGSYERFAMAGTNNEEDKNHLKKFTYYLFKTSQEKLQPIDPENPEARWVDKEKVAELLTHPRDKQFFRSIKDQI